MPLDSGAKSNGQDSVVGSEEWSGPWGVIEPVPQSVETLCVEINDEMSNPCVHYYPYRTIGHWNWKMEEPESLEIHIGASHIIVSGNGLRRLAEALHTGQLKLIRLTKTSVSGSEIRVDAIHIEA